MAIDQASLAYVQRRPRVGRRLLAALIALGLALAGLLASPVVCAAEEPAPKLHLVVWGETLSSISYLYDVGIDDLMRANGLTNAHIIRAGDQLLIPGATAVAEPPPNGGQPGGRVHVVAPGDSLFAIAAAYGVDVIALARANGIANPNFIQPGQRLIIPGAGDQAPAGQPPASEAPSADAPVTGERHHVVRAGETLYGIALEYGVSAESLIAANGIANPSLIHAGRRLLIPGAGGAAPAADPAPQQPPPSAPVAVPRGSYGVCAHLFDQDLGAVFGAVQGLGFTWVKQQIEWKVFEPAPGQIQWGALDAIVDAAAAAGHPLLFSVVKAPAWARPADTDHSVDGPPANPADYANFVGALAARYRGRVAAYEIWNEQNLWYEWGGKGKVSAAEYVALLREAYTRIKAADPSAIVVSGGLTPTGVNDGYVAFDDVHYLAQMFAAGAGPYFDALGAHPSGYNNPPDDTPEYNTTRTTEFKGHWSFYFRRFEQLYNVMAVNGQGGKKIWFTEFGWSSQQNPPEGYEYAADNTEEQQAAYLRRALELAAQKPYVGVVFVWNLNYAPVAGAGDEKAGFGLLRADGTPRPAYISLAGTPK